MKIVYSITKYMGHIAAGTVLVLMMLTMANIIGRGFFSAPVKGTLEICSYLLLIVVAMGLGAAALEGRHIKVDLLMQRLPKRAQFVIDNAMLTVSFILLGLLTWDNGRAAIQIDRYSSVLRLPQSPFRWIFTVGFGIFCICTLAVIIENFRKRGKHES